MCRHIRKLSSLVCLHNLGNKNYSKETHSSGQNKNQEVFIFSPFNFRAKAMLSLSN